ncbi:gp37 [Salisaeta icosahedral phage 1]|uniref:gp37 n=1 Tax=Salisaeta icosahedral phage 1 TaxID=1183239 RepID=UPI00025EA932|nr:gp37 [Salisaeta icosahedral phage 1]AFJ21492.1 gp37 [Salisaeta icosahedral phage 1]
MIVQRSLPAPRPGCLLTNKQIHVMGRFASDVNRGLGAGFQPNRSIETQVNDFLNRADQYLAKEAQDAQQWLNTLQNLKRKVQAALQQDIPSGIKQNGQQLLNAIASEIDRAIDYINKHSSSGGSGGGGY